MKARVSYLTIQISKRKNLSLPLKDEIDQFVTCLVLPECLSVKIAFHSRTVKRIVMSMNDATLAKVTYGKYATQVPDEVAYEIYEWFSSQ